MEEAILALSSDNKDTPPTTPQPQKAATTPTNGASGGWWGLGWNIIDTVKKQTESVISIYKEDLQEFTKTIQDDVKDAIKKTAEVTNNMAAANASSPPKSKMDELELSLDRRQARVTALQNELSTFVTEPTEIQDFQEWKTTWNIQSHTEQISILLAENEKMRAIHTKLVPVVISYATFWERYFYKLHKLLLEEERRAALVEKAVATSNDDEELAWDDDIDDATPRKEVPQLSEPAVPKAELEDYFDKLDVEDKEEQPTPSSPIKKEALSDEEKPQPTETAPQQAAPVKESESPESATPATTSPPTTPTPPVNTTTTTKKGEPEEEAWDNWE